MKIQWLGHASFAITTSSNKVIVTDPYESGGYNGAVGYQKIELKADVVTVSHQHADHNYTKSLQGNPRVIDRKGEYAINDIKINGISSFHDSSEGKERGVNIIFIYETDGLRLAHFGDLGHVLSKEQIKEIGELDVLFIPTGGYFTIDSKAATEMVKQIAPKVAIPMHYKTDALGFPIALVDDFLKDKKKVRRFDTSEIAVTKETLPSEPEAWVLPYTK
jgi:L-ascorbate metabolism protein UlaG (beta-lactamase superfamily)